MPKIKLNKKTKTNEVELEAADRRALETTADTLDWLWEHGKCAAARDGAVNVRATLTQFEPPAKPTKPAAPVAK